MSAEEMEAAREASEQCRGDTDAVGVKGADPVHTGTPQRTIDRVDEAEPPSAADTKSSPPPLERKNDGNRTSGTKIGVVLIGIWIAGLFEFAAGNLNAALKSLDNASLRTESQDSIQWTKLAGIDDGNAGVIVTAAVLLIASLNVAAIASILNDQPSELAKEILRRWGRRAQLVAYLVVSMSIAVSLTRFPDSPALGLLFLFISLISLMVSDLEVVTITSAAVASAEREERERWKAFEDFYALLPNGARRTARRRGRIFDFVPTFYRRRLPPEKRKHAHITVSAQYITLPLLLMLPLGITLIGGAALGTLLIVIPVDQIPSDWSKIESTFISGVYAVLLVTFPALFAYFFTSPFILVSAALNRRKALVSRAIMAAFLLMLPFISIGAFFRPVPWEGYFLLIVTSYFAVAIAYLVLKAALVSGRGPAWPVIATAYAWLASDARAARQRHDGLRAQLGGEGEVHRRRSANVC